MGVAYYIALDSGEDAVAEEIVDGKTVTDSEALLNEIALAHGMQELHHYFGFDADEFFDAFGVDAGSVPETEVWHDAGAGEAYFRALAARVAGRPDGGTHGALIDELHAFAAVLEKAKAAGQRWRLSIDI
jgi:hypothetical protein